MRIPGVASILFAATLASSGCASTQAEAEARPSITGSVALPSGAVVTSGAVVHVKIIDQTEGKEIGSQSIDRPNAFPVDFEVRYNPADVVSGHTYGVEASIVVWGDTKFKSATPVPVLAQGTPATVQVQTEATD